MSVVIKINGAKEFRQAVRKSPAVVVKEFDKLLVRSMAVYKRGIRESPWRVGGSGGGAPVATGHLLRSHKTTFTKFKATLFPSAFDKGADYGFFVHEGTVKMKKRPWLDHVAEKKTQEIRTLVTKFLEDVADHLAKS